MDYYRGEKMTIENILDKTKLIAELKETHKELVDIYKSIFEYKYGINKDFKDFIDNQYRENGVSAREQEAWKDNFCHRASYTLLNKILFIRICEDKGFMLNPEDYIAGEPKDPHIGEKLSKKGLQKWANLVTNYTLGELVKLAFLDMKKSYTNIILYKEDRYEILNPTTEELGLKYLDGNQESKKFVLQFEKILDSIVDKLDTNRFDFKNADGNILGDVYEKFMDRDTRKAIGQFYTPEFVIEYILKNTVADADVVENPFVSVADISCGSGHFLIMAYDILRDKFTNNLELLRDKYVNEIYTVKRHGKVEQLTGREYWKEENVHYHLLKHCIYGADIDSFAVQLTTINLLLKDLDNFTDELNIIECDSLIKWEEDYDWRDLRRQLEDISMLYTIKYRDINGVEHVEEIGGEKAREIVNLCEFWDKKYDYVVGNPPYFIVTDDIKKKYYLNNYISAKFKIDVYTLFIERGLSQTNKEGFNGYITPNSYLDNYYCRNVRDIMLNHSIDCIVPLDNGVFEDAVVHPVIYIIRKTEYLPDIDNDIRIHNNFGGDNEEIYHIAQSSFFSNGNHEFIVSLKGETELIIDKMKKNSIQLKEIVNITQTIKTGDDKKYLYNRKLKENFKPVLRGKDIGRYEKKFSNVYLDYGNWLRIPRHPKFFEQEKLLIRETGNRLTATYDDEHYYTMSSLYVVNRLSDSVNLKIVLGFLNSSLIQFFMKNIVYDKTKGAFTKARIFHLDQIPIIKQLPIEIEKELGDCVDTMLELNLKLMSLKFRLGDKSKSEIYGDYNKYCEMKYIIKSKIEENDRQINYLVYDAYGLSEKEINIIEKTINDLDDNNTTGIKEIDFDTFRYEYYSYGKDLEYINYEYDVTFKQLLVWISMSDEKLRYNNKNQYNLNELYLIIDSHLRRKCEDIGTRYNNFININEIIKVIRKEMDNFDDIMDIVRKEYPAKKATQIVIESMSLDLYTWNAYRKAKKSGKINKTFIKYYDTNYYGLAEWSDEIHKNYFLDAIEEYTTNNPNEKKVRDIFKLFEDLEIEDKKDYIEVIQEKIKTAFR